MEYTKTPACSYSEALVSYLYGEISPVESRDFEKHMGACGICQSEFAEFTQVRDSISEWRERVFNPEGEIIIAETPRLVPFGAVAQRPRYYSARAAIREFFALSPLWLRGTIAFGVVAFFALAAFSILRVSRPETVVVEKPVAVMPSQQEIDTLVLNSTEEIRAQRAATTPFSNNTARHGTPISKFASSQPGAGATNSGRRTRTRTFRPESGFNDEDEVALSESESGQLLWDLGLAASKEDENLPRLSDLVEEPEAN
jgi:anti-sigma factor RsiW